MDSSCETWLYQSSLQTMVGLSKIRDFPSRTRVRRYFTEAQNDILTSCFEALSEQSPTEWTVLEGFAARPDVVAGISGMELGSIQKVLSAFTLPDGELNSGSKRLMISMFPRVRLCFGERCSYVLFSTYSLFQALYDSPFYWMFQDSNYKNTAAAHRGQFTEEFVHERLKRVFGGERVLRGVKVLE